MYVQRAFFEMSNKIFYHGYMTSRYPFFFFVKEHLGYFLVTTQMALVGEDPPANVGDVRDPGLIPGLGRSPGGGHGNSLQYPCLENPMDRGSWWLQSTRSQKVRHD